MNYLDLKNTCILLDTKTYRGIQVDFYNDPVGEQAIAVWNDSILEFGYYNTLFLSEVEALIDDQLDTITRFEDTPELYGGKLEYFQNGSFSDLRLSYRGRVLKVFLDIDENDLFSIIEESKKIIFNYLSKKRLQPLQDVL